MEVNNKPKGKRLPMLNLKMVLKTSRPTTSFIAGLAMFIILMKDNQFPAWQNVIESIPIVLVTMTGFILNDIYDFEKDARGKLNRPIALGLLDRRVAGFYALFFAVCAIAIEGIINKFASLGILAATLIGVLVYSPISKHVPTIKGLATAALTLTPILYASTVLDKNVPVFIYVATVTFMIGREILLDIKDFQLDLTFGLKTLVAYLGIPKSRLLAWTLMFVGIVYFIAQLHSLSGILLAFSGLISLTIACWLDRHNQVKGGGLTKLTLVLCILAIPFGL